jgi:hypothetical protein
MTSRKPVEEFDGEQDLLNVIKYNQDNSVALVKRSQDAVSRAEASLSSAESESLDLSDVDEQIRRSHAALTKHGILKPRFRKYRCTPEEPEPTKEPVVEDKHWHDLVAEANAAGYSNVTIQDVLTSDQIADADARYQEIEDAFASKTNLRRKDYAFLIAATALQVVRQYVLTQFEDRVSSSEADKKKPHASGSPSEEATRRYYVSRDDIENNPRVPYDVVVRSREFDLGGKGKGLSGFTHRYRTLGHDPLLGYCFGTANILTNTLTDFRFLTYHIKYCSNASGIYVPTIAQHADTALMFRHVIDRFTDDKASVAAAICKQYWHIRSDESKAGLPIPLSTIISSPEIAERLAKYGVDALALKTVGKQAGYALLINFVVSTIHGAMYDEREDGGRRFYEVRTRKILLYSNLIASLSNLVVVGIGVGIGAASNNPETIRKSLKYVDVGGLLVTIARLFTDIRFITKVKDEFISMEIDRDIQREIDELDRMMVAR